MLEATDLAYCFPMRIDLVSQRNTAILSGFSSYRNIRFVHNCPIELIVETRISLGRKPSTFEAGGSCTLFPYKN
jgi:hypothetical protein